MNDETIAVRVSGKLRNALKREQEKRSRMAGAEVKESAVIRSILEGFLLKKSRPA